MFGILGNVFDESQDVIPQGYTNLYNVLSVGVNVMTGITIAFGVFGFIYSAILLATSGGEPEAYKNFRQGIKYSIVALIIALGMVTFKVVIINTLGANTPLSNDLPDY